MSVQRTLHRKMMGLASTFGPTNSAVTSWLKLSCQQQGCQLVTHPYVWSLKKDHQVIRFAPRHYAQIPYVASRFDRYFDSLVPEVMGTDSVLDFSRVRTDTYRKPGLTFESSACPEEADVLDSYLELYKPSRDHLAFDIGARCGVSTYILSQLAGEVVAFESDPLAIEILQRNIERHDIRNVTLVKGIPKLAHAFSTWGIPSFCKISIDGDEPRYLAAAQAVLRECETHLAVRSTHEALGVCHQAKVEQILQQCGFEVKSDAPLGTTSAWPA